MIEFTKMHGAGNDYIYVNTMLYNIEDPEEFSKKWSRYHFGIGSDGLILIGYPESIHADYSMRIFNNDGSEAMMCGNGTRCVAKYLHDKGITDKTIIRLETRSGIKILHLHLDENGKTESVTVDMGCPIMAEDAKHQFCPEKATGLPEGTFVSMGNPHYVIFLDEDVEQYDIEAHGKALEFHPAFPERCNIEFANILPDGTIRMRVWERGSGITWACGTGSCATTVAAFLTGRAPRQSTIKMDGGSVTNCWQESDSHIMMTGPAEFVFDGTI
ncbi:MAG: diaminopimelate epimerase [Bacteroidaceae bacterium]|nr:diaminopimelate epimerase [Bacteroidaceae bacterium]